MKQFTLFSLLTVLIFINSCKSKEKEDTTKVLQEVLEAVSIRGTEVTYATDSTTMKGYIAYDESIKGTRPGIIVVHEWWGHNDYVRQRADQLAELGYTAIAIDMYGDGKQAGHPDDAGKFAMNVMTNLPAAKARFDAALELLKEHPSVNGEQLAAIGYCFGGSVALTMANAGADLDAVAAFHSGVALPVMPGEDLKAKVLVCNGGADTFVSPESVTAFKEAMDATGQGYEYIAYPGVKHSFTSKEADVNGEKFGLPLAYDAAADKASWEKMQELFATVFE